MLCLVMTLLSFIWAKDLHLAIGESHRLSAKGPAWVENRKVIELVDLGSEFKILAKSPGVSELRNGNDFHRIVVLSAQQSQTYQLLQSVVSKTLGLQLSLEGEEVTVGGRLVRWSDWALLMKACQARHCQYQFKPSMSSLIAKESLSSIATLLKKQALPLVKIEQQDGFSVKLPSTSPAYLTAEQFFRSLGISVHKSESSLEIAPLIKVQITVAEVKRQGLLKYGLQWPSSYSAKLLPTAESGEANFTVNALETKGLGRILASPNILCRSGKEAEFLAGGEFPIKILNFRIQDVIWKKYGVLLKIKPLADYSGRMSVGLETEVSTIDNSKMIDGVPGMFTNRIQSHFDLEEPRTIALSGLIKSGASNASQGLPLLSRIPILGSLFASKDFQEERTELVVFVRPEVVDPSSFSDEAELPKEMVEAL